MSEPRFEPKGPVRATATLAQLSINPAINPRASVGNIDDLKAQIAHEGFNDALWVRKVDHGDELRYEVIDGKRRVAALTALDWPHDVAVDIFDVDDATARSMALAANVVRMDLGPADEAVAFLNLHKGGMPVGVIATRFARSEALVRQRMGLGSLHPSILEALRQEELGIETAQAFTLTPNPTRQLEVFLKLGGRAMSWNVKRELTTTSVAASDRRAKWVGAEAYEAAGGTLTRDLFSEEAWFNDGALLDRLVEDKLDQTTRELKQEGWSFVQVLKDGHQLHKWDQEKGRGRKALTDEQQAELDLLTTRAAEIATRVEAIETRMVAIDEMDTDEQSDAQEDALNTKWQALDAEKDTLEEQGEDLQTAIDTLTAKPFAAAQMKRLGALIVFNHNSITLSRGHARPGQPVASSPARSVGEGGAHAPDEGDASEDHTPAPLATTPSYSEAVTDILGIAACKAIKLAMVKTKPAFTARLGLACRIREVLDESSPLNLNWKQRDGGEAFEALRKTILSQFLLSDALAAIDFHAATLDLPAIMAVLETMEPEQITLVDALCTAIIYDLKPYELKADADTRFIIDQLDPDMRAEGFTPDEAFLNRLSREQLLAISTDLNPVEPPVTKAKKPDMITALLPLIATHTWLPQALRSANYEGPGTEAWGRQFILEAAEEMMDPIQPSPAPGEGASPGLEPGEAGEGSEQEAA